MKLRIGADSALYAAARFVNCVSPPYGGIVTPRRIEMAVKMLRILKLETMVFMAGLTWMMIETARGNANGIGAVLPLGFLVCLFGTLGAGFVLMGRDAA